MKLKTKIQLFSSLFMLVLIVIINAAIYFLFHNISVDSELEELADHTNAIVSALNSDTEIVESELLKAYLPTDGMIRVIPEEGEPLSHTKEIEFLQLQAEYSTTESQETVKDNQLGKFAVIEKPIIWSDGSIVTLQVTKHLSTLKNNMTTLLYVLLIASVIILIPIMVGGNVLSRFLLSPIQELIQTMKENTREAKWEKIKVKKGSKDELYELENAYNDMIDQLKENYEKQEVFVSDASHELKTPISIVKSYAQLIERRGMDNPALIKESVEAISSEADRMQKLVEQMLTLAKNKRETHFEPVNIPMILEDTITAFKAYNREIHFESNVEEANAIGDVEQLKQVMYILVDNALKYSEADVYVKAWQDEDFINFSVRDHGQGIPEKDSDHIFNRFYRVDKARSRGTGGTGLGLSIAKSIVELHGGNISVKSTEGLGSIFTVKLPLNNH